MPRPRPCFLRAPGVGLALVDLDTKIVHSGYPIEGGRDAVLTAAISIARRCLGLAPDATSWDGLSDELYSDWRALGGEQVTCVRGQRAPCILDSAAIANTRIADPHGDAPGSAVDWDGIRAKLIEQGLIIDSRAIDSPLLSATALCEVVEIRDSAGKVLSEGKGVAYDTAMQGALGEGVERLAAQLPDEERLFISTARELAASGVAIPALAAEARDLFSPDLPLEWVSAQTFSGRSGALPAELVYYPFQPGSAVKAFSAQHTAGLAVGASLASATAAALREAVETDAYWLSMRCMRIDSRFDALADSPVPEIRRIVRSLAEIGIRTHAGIISFDWPVPIVHVVLENASEGLPALSHGLALGVNPFNALQRALLESVQVYTGMEKVARLYWPEISVSLSRTADPSLVWSDPAYARRIVAMFENAPRFDPATATAHLSTVGELDAWMTQHEMTAWCAALGKSHGLEVARAYIEGGVSPFSERSQPSRRVCDMLTRYGLQHPYLDPVLT